MTTAGEAAAKFGHRSGFDLVSFREVGLPVYRTTVIALVMEEKPLPALQEFALRAVDAGFETPTAMTEFLGLEERDLDEALYGLVTEGFMRLSAGSNGQGDTFSVTQRGTSVMEEFRLARTEERTYMFDYDGLLRRPLSLRPYALRARRLKDLGGLEIAPAPPKRPRVEELDVDRVESVLRESRKFDRAWRILELLRVARSEVLFVPATMLVFRANVGDEVQATFVVDGKLSEEHELAFAESQGPARLGLGAAQAADLKAVASEIIGAKEAKRVADEVLAGQESSQEHQAVEERAPAPTNELLQTFDHPRYLDEALNKSTTRLLIVSPWIKRRVVDNAFIGRLRELLRRGCQVRIGYGFGHEGQGSDDSDAVKSLQRLANEFSTFRLVRLGDTHAKVLVSDDAFAIFTSFNWLSFVGDPQRTFRDERGLLVRNPDVVEEASRQLLRRLEAEQP